MKNRYLDLIEHTFEFPQAEFEVVDDELLFHHIPVMDLIKQYGTPLKITYIPKIRQNIEKALMDFNVALAKASYKGKYTYCYCTKSSHFSFVLEEAVQAGAHLETSSAYDLEIIKALHAKDVIDRDHYIICNGYKRPEYTRLIRRFIEQGFHKLIPVLDNKEELETYKTVKSKTVPLGIRIASEEEPRFNFYTSRLGIRYDEILDFYHTQIAENPKFELKMLHFFINTGIKDSSYYWNELRKFLNVYCELKKACPTLTGLNIGGGFPIKNSLGFKFNYAYMAEEIVAQIKSTCARKGVEEPDIFSEFGSYTVGEAGAVFYKVLGEKQQNDRELWYMIDSSFMTTLPDSWAIGQRFLMLPINRWSAPYQRVNLGGLTCDSLDFYDEEAHEGRVFLPTQSEKEPLYVGFFHTGAYQESIGGFGGIQHCLIPAPKHVIISKDEESGEHHTKLFSKEQSAKSMLKTLGY